MSQKSPDIMSGYEKLQMVGKGSFGTATLYKRREDDILVVMKHIQVSDMSSTERNMALNEVKVISSLDHENIIKYLGSFEAEDSLVIIMEYATGGNLSQLIRLKKNNDDPIAESSILYIFSQICNAIGYMHMHKILHRDLKSANIFLTRDGTVKIGDFGISKMLNTRSQAQTIVGTPYYLSPEMCEGKEYNETSDIWSLGCILYELTCLRKPFEATTLPALIQKITGVDYQPIPINYSDGLHRLVQMILQRDRHRRPSARYMYQTIIPAIYENLRHADKWPMPFIFNRSIPKDRSVLYKLVGCTSKPSLHPVRLPHEKIIDFSNSATHCIALTADRHVYSWGEDDYGQLGHGQPSSEYKELPVIVDYFRTMSIIRCFAGESFSIFLTATKGNLLTCGDGSYGCCGHGDWNNVSKPTIIKSLINTRITTLSCGPTHVIALATTGKVYTWGSGTDGQLGLGSTTPHCCKPTQLLDLPNDADLIKEVYAGYDNSMILTTNGKLLASGSNMNNKLGLGELFPLSKRFVLVSGIEDRIQSVALALKHTVLLTEDGAVLCMGSNQDHQCGANRQFVNGCVFRVQRLPKIQMMSAGTCFTIAASQDNVIYFWGTHYHKRCDVRDGTTSDMSGLVSTQIEPSPASSFEVSLRFRRLQYQFGAGDKTALNGEFWSPIIQRTPTPILALYASPGHVGQGKIVRLAGLCANAYSVSVLVHTTASPPIRPRRRTEEEDDSGLSMLMNWNRSNRIYKNQRLPNSPQIV